eukprot:1467774-Rhodomonas_salina.3
MKPAKSIERNMANRRTCTAQVTDFNSFKRGKLALGSFPPQPNLGSQIWNLVQYRLCRRTVLKAAARWQRRLIASRLLEFIRTEAQSMTLGIGSLGAAATIGYWASQNEKKGAILAERSRADKAENEQK